MKEVLETMKDGVKVGGKLIPTVRFVDDQGQAMIASSEEGLQRIMKRTNSVIKTYGMRINIKETKVMKIGRDSFAMSIMINGKELE